MPASDAVGAVAVSRAEVRKSLVRMEGHLARGVRGGRGVRREIDFLDALHRQTIRLSGVATGNPYTSGPSSFGTKAAKGLASGNTRTIGKVKSSILADFSSDGLQPARDWTLSPVFADIGGEWVWQANASACPSCLGRHGNKYQGPMIPMHPSCLCIPIPPVNALREGLQPLSPDVMGDQLLAYGDPRYYRMAKNLKNGTNSLSDAAAVENVNGQARGFRAWQEHMQKQEVFRVDGGVPRIPTSDPIPRGFSVPDAPPAPAPAPTAPALTTPSERFAALASETEVEALAQLQRLSSLTDEALSKLSNRATKKAQKEFRDAIKILEDKLSTMTAAQQAEFSKALSFIDSVRLEALKNVPKDGKFVLGHWAELSKVPRRGVVHKELMIQTKRVDWKAWDDYITANNKWVKDNNLAFRNAQTAGENPWNASQLHTKKFPRPLEPKGIITDATAEEISSTLVHELTHIIDTIKGQVPRKQAKEMWELAAKEYATGTEEFWYAASKTKYGVPQPAETVAELSRFYVEGWEGLSAEAWRAKYPEMARFVEEVIYA